MDASTKSKRLQLQASAEKISPMPPPPLPLKRVLPSARMRLSLPTAPTNDVLCFLAKVAALEAARRISAARCPVLWNAVQALQLLTYPPFKWAQRWTPLRFLIKGIQNISKPLLLISVTTAIVDHSKHAERPNETRGDITSTSASSIHLENEGSERTTEGTFAENWLVQLFKELEKQCITLPERFDKCELERFYSAANGDLSVLLSSLKKTIRWRETYHIFSVEELEKWSHLVFWHGCDVMSRPCLVIRFGFACSHLDPKDRPGFAQAVVSQIEHGIMHLVKEEEPTISVLMDCKGVSPFRFPMQMLRAVTNIVQDNYPNRLGRLLIVRLPPIVRVIAQTFMQVLKPATRQKIQLEGEGYYKAISELLQIVPAFVGGDCKCAQCRKIAGKVESKIEEICRSSSSKMQHNEKELEVELEEIVDIPLTEMESGALMECNHLLRRVLVGFVMLLFAIALMVVINEPM